ncbi:uncharacterized protein MONOS_330 [Monocercomonoides exilis]|uniref:uncharacterized protein n=1 Tax=Monocercomonoides exilis TaxID=2049356 RepID=UPI003559B8CA|nr:hypothetical protein MONOS_330 [Monocercomonoides exilis]|eukprot:MONOS_330.1-p1 / transcript=MONOS_330.1 / gene=MONOS_330 / organism=Monocercomonoides_exilis_PA203 / gene_product=unspecified product / transcript_product=unspecified product / location=Mono_scaffold00005:177546-187744(-) / protein_length=3232 / sequence_SO=supercontig / SO=protein_coding / is_pseudo=false
MRISSIYWTKIKVGPTIHHEALIYVEEGELRIRNVGVVEEGTGGLEFAIGMIGAGSGTIESVTVEGLSFMSAVFAVLEGGSVSMKGVTLSKLGIGAADKKASAIELAVGEGQTATIEGCKFEEIDGSTITEGKGGAMNVRLAGSGKLEVKTTSVVKCKVNEESGRGGGMYVQLEDGSGNDYKFNLEKMENNGGFKGRDIYLSAEDLKSAALRNKFDFGIWEESYDRVNALYGEDRLREERDVDLFALWEYTGSDVYIGQSGKDIDYCGAHDDPCKSVNYGTKHLKGGDKRLVIIDEGEFTDEFSAEDVSMEGESTTEMKGVNVVLEEKAGATKGGMTSKGISKVEWIRFKVGPTIHHEALIYVEEGELRIRNVGVVEEGTGGLEFAIGMIGAGSGTIESVTVEGLSFMSAVFAVLEGGSVSMKGVTLSKLGIGAADKKASAIELAVGEGQTATIEGCKFEEIDGSTITEGKGGAMNVRLAGSGKLEFRDCLFKACYANEITGRGGAMYMYLNDKCDNFYQFDNIVTLNCIAFKGRDIYLSAYDLKASAIRANFGEYFQKDTYDRTDALFGSDRKSGNDDIDLFSLWEYRNEVIYVSSDNSFEDDLCGTSERPCNSLHLGSSHLKGKEQFKLIVVSSVNIGEDTDISGVVITPQGESPEEAQLIVNIPSEHVPPVPDRLLLNREGNCNLRLMRICINANIKHRALIETQGKKLEIEKCSILPPGEESVVIEPIIILLSSGSLVINDMKLNTFSCANGFLKAMSKTTLSIDKLLLTKGAISDAAALQLLRFEQCELNNSQFIGFTLPTDKTASLIQTIFNYSTFALSNCTFDKIKSEAHGSCGGSVMSQLPLGSRLSTSKCTFRESFVDEIEGRGGAIKLVLTYEDKDSFIFKGDEYNKNKAKYGRDIHLTTPNLKTIALREKFAFDQRKSVFDKENALVGTDSDTGGEIDLFSLWVYSGTDVFVAAAYGEDEFYCGRVSEPCETVSFGLSHLLPAQSSCQSTDTLVSTENELETISLMQHFSNRMSKHYSNEVPTRSIRIIEKASLKNEIDFTGIIVTASTVSKLTIINIAENDDAHSSQSGFMINKGNFVCSYLTVSIDKPIHQAALFDFSAGTTDLISVKFSSSLDIDFTLISIRGGAFTANSIEANSLKLQKPFFVCDIDQDAIDSILLQSLKFDGITVESQSLLSIAGSVSACIIGSTMNSVHFGKQTSSLTRTSSETAGKAALPLGSIIVAHFTKQTLLNISKSTFSSTVSIAENSAGSCIHATVGSVGKVQIENTEFFSNHINEANGKGGAVYFSLSGNNEKGWFSLQKAIFKLNIAKYGTDAYFYSANLIDVAKKERFDLDWTMYDVTASNAFCGTDEATFKDVEKNLFDFWFYRQNNVYMDSTGIDTDTCGSNKDPCKTFNFGVTHLIGIKRTVEIVTLVSVAGAATLTNTTVIPQNYESNHNKATLDVNVPNTDQVQHALISTCGCNEFKSLTIMIDSHFGAECLICNVFGNLTLTILQFSSKLGQNAIKGKFIMCEDDCLFLSQVKFEDLSTAGELIYATSFSSINLDTVSFKNLKSDALPLMRVSTGPTLLIFNCTFDTIDIKAETVQADATTGAVCLSPEQSVYVIEKSTFSKITAQVAQGINVGKGASCSVNMRLNGHLSIKESSFKSSVITSGTAHEAPETITPSGKGGALFISTSIDCTGDFILYSVDVDKNAAYYGEDVFLSAYYLKEAAAKNRFNLNFGADHQKKNSLWGESLQEHSAPVSLYTFWEYFSSTIYVSSAKGRNNNLCGKVEEPCLTIEVGRSHLEESAKSYDSAASFGMSNNQKELIVMSDAVLGNVVLISDISFHSYEDSVLASVIIYYNKTESILAMIINQGEASIKHLTFRLTGNESLKALIHSGTEGLQTSSASSRANGAEETASLLLESCLFVCSTAQSNEVQYNLVQVTSGSVIIKECDCMASRFQASPFVLSGNSVQIKNCSSKSSYTLGSKANISFMRISLESDSEFVMSESNISEINSYYRAACGGLMNVHVKETGSIVSIKDSELFGIGCEGKESKGGVLYCNIQEAKETNLHFEAKFHHNSAQVGKDAYFVANSLAEQVKKGDFFFELDESEYSRTNALYGEDKDGHSTSTDLFTIWEHHSKTITVDSKTGNDADQCGTEQLPCMTIQFGIKHLIINRSSSASPPKSNIQISNETYLYSPVTLSGFTISAAKTSSVPSIHLLISDAGTAISLKRNDHINNFGGDLDDAAEDASIKNVGYLSFKTVVINPQVSHVPSSLFLSHPQVAGCTLSFYNVSFYSDQQVGYTLLTVKNGICIIERSTLEIPSMYKTPFVFTSETQVVNISSFKTNSLTLQANPLISSDEIKRLNIVNCNFNSITSSSPKGTILLASITTGTHVSLINTKFNSINSNRVKSSLLSNHVQILSENAISETQSNDEDDTTKGGCCHFILKDDGLLNVNDCNFTKCTINENYGKGGAVYMDIQPGCSSKFQYNGGFFKECKAHSGNDIYLISDNLVESAALSRFNFSLTKDSFDRTNSIYGRNRGDEADTDIISTWEYKNPRIFVSKSGEDYSMCGTVEIPCNHIEYGILHLESNNGKLILMGDIELSRNVYISNTVIKSEETEAPISVRIVIKVASESAVFKNLAIAGIESLKLVIADPKSSTSILHSDGAHLTVVDCTFSTEMEKIGIPLVTVKGGQFTANGLQIVNIVFEKDAKDGKASTNGVCPMLFEEITYVQLKQLTIRNVTTDRQPFISVDDTSNAKKNYDVFVMSSSTLDTITANVDPISAQKLDSQSLTRKSTMKNDDPPSSITSVSAVLTFHSKQGNKAMLENCTFSNCVAEPRKQKPSSNEMVDKDAEETIGSVASFFSSTIEMNYCRVIGTQTSTESLSVSSSITNSESSDLFTPLDSTDDRMQNKNTANSDNDQDLELCGWTTGMVSLKNCSAIFSETVFSKSSEGAISMSSKSSLDIKNCQFYDNTFSVAKYLSARRNIRCGGGSTLNVENVKAGDGIGVSGTTSASLWIYKEKEGEGCIIKGKETAVLAPLFTPVVTQIVSTPKDDLYQISFKGELLLPCNLMMEVVVKGLNSTGKSEKTVRWSVQQELTSFVNEYEVIGQVPLSLLSNVSEYDEVVVRLVYGEEMAEKKRQTTTSFVLIEAKEYVPPTPKPKFGTSYVVGFAVAFGVMFVVMVALIVMILVLKKRRKKRRRRKKKGFGDDTLRQHLIMSESESVYPGQL